MKYLTKDEMVPVWNQFLKEIEEYLVYNNRRNCYLQASIPDYLFSSLMNGIIKEGDDTIIYRLPALISPMNISGCEIHFTETNENKLSLYDYLESKTVSVIEKDLESVESNS